MIRYLIFYRLLDYLFLHTTFTASRGEGGGVKRAQNTPEDLDNGG